MEEPKYQTRSEETGIQQHETFAAACQAAANDETIWKISFTLPEGERVRLIKDGGNWVFRPLLDGE